MCQSKSVSESLLVTSDHHPKTKLRENWKEGKKAIFSYSTVAFLERFPIFPFSLSFSLFFSTSPRPVVVVLASGSSAKGGREYQEGTNQGPAPLGALGSLLARFDNVS